MRKLVLILALIAVTVPAIAQARVIHHHRRYHRHYVHHHPHYWHHHRHHRVIR